MVKPLNRWADALKRSGEIDHPTYVFLQVVRLFLLILAYWLLLVYPWAFRIYARVIQGTDLHLIIDLTLH